LDSSKAIHPAILSILYPYAIMLPEILKQVQNSAIVEGNIYVTHNYILKAYWRSNLRPGLQWLGGNWTVIHQERNPSIE
jgi:hypothetical protein